MKFILRVIALIIGSIFLHDCPAEPMLPIFLIVYGIELSFTHSKLLFGQLTVFFLIGVVGSTMQIFAQITGSLLKDGNTTWKTVKDAVIILMWIFLACWVITGNL